MQVLEQALLGLLAFAGAALKRQQVTRPIQLHRIGH
jgi:hypothetical protein